MKIAVVGAGIFGVTIALKLDKLHDVTLYESSRDIMTAASRTNQLRLHRGYHYPRSPETVSALLKSIDFFVDEYQKSVVDDYDHYYCISREGSMVTPEQYLQFCDSFGLDYEVIENFGCVNNEKIALTVRVKEALLDYQSVYNTCWRRLMKSNVQKLWATRFTKSDIENFDVVLNCTYANINELLEEDNRLDYQFEVCEKIGVEMPLDMQDKSIVVMDGPFMCVDPYGRTGMSLLGNVVHAIHYTNVGHFPKVPVSMMRDLNQGFLDTPSETNWEKFIESGKEYIPSLASAKYRGSMYTIRAVLPNMDDTDGRPTIVSESGPKIINVFSGKIDTCVMAAKDIIDKLSEE